jgi:hypothetical protein
MAQIFFDLYQIFIFMFYAIYIAPPMSHTIDMIQGEHTMRQNRTEQNRTEQHSSVRLFAV